MLFRSRVYERTFGKRWKRMIYSGRAKAFASRLDELFVSRDLRQFALICCEQWSIGIVECVRELQSFFNAVGTPEPYIIQYEIENLYRATAIIAQGRHGHVSYAGAKLGLHSNPKDHVDLINAIHDHVRLGRVQTSCAAADNVFRAMLEMLGESDEWLSNADQAKIREFMMPFARLRDDAILVERHTKWA